MIQNQLERELRTCVTRGRVLTAAAQLAGYDADALGYKLYRPDAVVIPADADELIRVVRHARQWDVPVCLRGAGTSLSGGPVAAQGGVIVHTSALRNVRQINAEGFWCEVESGVALNRLDEALQPHGLFYPPDPSSGPVCTLGGNVAMNAGGAHCFRFGVTSNYVLGVEAVLLDGSVHRFGGPAGGRGAWREDWKRLMVGSEGTLAAFTRFWLRLLPRPEKAWTFRATFADLHSAERAIHALVAHPSFPVAIELMDPRCVAMVENSPMAVGLPTDAFLLVSEIDGPPELVDGRVEQVARLLRDAGSPDVQYSDDERLRQKLWRARKVAGGLMGQLSPDMLVQDAVIPKRALADLLQLIYDEADAAGVPAVNVFHAGDGNLHPNFLFDARVPGQLEKVEAISKRLMHRVVEVGGTLSGEHGIGNDKAAYMPLVFGQEALRLQLAVPAAFNPRHQFNPLKIFCQRRFEPESEQAEREGAAEPVRSATGASAVTGDPGSPPASEADDLGSARGERLFEHFLDPVDGVACVSADTTGGELRELAEREGLRFPLLMDHNATLREHLAASGHAPASSRFGPYLDNIVGMNWRLPGGRLVRIGERVVKSTTGYDLPRFLLSARGGFGEAVDLVVRLRPLCEMTRVAELLGGAEAVRRAAHALTHTCWLHWLDSLDVLVGGADEGWRLRASVNCPGSEWSIYESHLASLAAAGELRLEVRQSDASLLDGCPDLVLKTTPDRLLELAGGLSEEEGLRSVSLCYNGVLHGYWDDAAEAVERSRSLARRVAPALEQDGGECHSRHLPPPAARDAEAAWLGILQKEFAAP